MPARKDLPSLSELQARTIQQGECWIWQGAFAGDYPCIRRGGKLYKVHRLAWEILNEQSMEASDAMHRCNNKGCINPLHIVPGNHQQNSWQHFDDSVRSGSVCAHGKGWRAKIMVRGTEYKKWFKEKREADVWLYNKLQEIKNG